MRDHARPEDSGANSSAKGRGQPRDEQLDFARLDRAVRGLVDRYRAIEAENAELRRQLEESTTHRKAVDDRLLEINQRRQDAMKRLDDVIALVDNLDARFEALASD